MVLNFWKFYQTLGLMTISITGLSIMTLSIMLLGYNAYSIMTLCIMTLHNDKSNTQQN
jgi:hypothetical protein